MSVRRSNAAWGYSILGALVAIVLLTVVTAIAGPIIGRVATTLSERSSGLLATLYNRTEVMEEAAGELRSSRPSPGLDSWSLWHR